MVAAGRALTAHDSGELSALRQADATALDWTKGRLILNNVVLADIVDRIRPYHRGRILLVGGVGRQRLSATINLDRTDAWLDGLAQTRMARVLRLPGVTIIS